MSPKLGSPKGPEPSRTGSQSRGSLGTLRDRSLELMSPKWGSQRTNSQVPPVPVPTEANSTACIPQSLKPHPRAEIFHIPPPPSPGHPQITLEEGTERSCDQQSHPIEPWGVSWGHNVCHQTPRGGSPIPLVPMGSQGWRQMGEIGQWSPRDGCPPQGQSCDQSPSRGHKQLKGPWEQCPSITHMLALESCEDLPANPHGARSQVR